MPGMQNVVVLPEKCSVHRRAHQRGHARNKPVVILAISMRLNRPSKETKGDGAVDRKCGACQCDFPRRLPRHLIAKQDPRPRRRQEGNSYEGEAVSMCTVVVWMGFSSHG